MILRIAWMLARPGSTGAAVIALPVIAFATVTALLLTVVGGASSFWAWNDSDGFLYQACAVLALTLLIVPLGSLGAAASRLSARRRDDRLATLRLLGATPATVAAITVLESAVLAALGAIGGVAVYLAATPAVGLIHFRGEALGAAGVLLPPIVIAAIVLGVAALAAASAILGLRRVIISPLGVRMRDEAPRPHWVRLLVAVAVVVFANLVMGQLGQLAFAVILTLLVVGFGGTLLALNLVGPWVLRRVATRQARRAATPERLLAARSILESPKAAWTQVSGVAMTSFIAVIAGSAVTLAELAGGDPGQARLIADIRTGVLITVVASFLMVACSVGVNQAASILDRGDLYASLAKLGMPLRTMDRARRRTVMLPLRITALGSAAIAAIVIFPVTGATLLFAPLTAVVVVGVLVAGIALVWLGLVATTTVLARAARLP